MHIAFLMAILLFDGLKKKKTNNIRSQSHLEKDCLRWIFAVTEQSTVISLQCTCHISHPRPSNTERQTNGEPGGICTKG